MKKISLRLYKAFRHISLFSFCPCRQSLMCASIPLLMRTFHRVLLSSPPFLSSVIDFFHLFHPSVSFRERHTPRLRRVLSAPCGASNSDTDFFLAGFYPYAPSLPDALKVIAAAYSFPRYGRRIVAAA